MPIMAGTEGDLSPAGPQDGADATFSISHTISKLKRSLARNDVPGADGTRSSAVILDFETIGMDDGDDSPIDLVNDPCSSDGNMVINLSDETEENGLRSEDSNSAEPAVTDAAKNMVSVTSAVVASKSSEGSGNGNAICDNTRTVYSCNHCDYRARTHSGWNNHFKRLHPRLAQNSSSLAKHYAKVTTTSQKSRVPTLYFCQYCNYITLSMAGFIIHSSKVHPKRKANPLKQGSPITTDSNKKYLEALYSSRDETPRTKSKVRQLLEKYHKDSKVLEEVPRFLSLKCIICKQNCTTPGMLGQHYELCHSAQGPEKSFETGLYHCKLCPQESLTRSELYKHYVKNHYMDAFYAWGMPNQEAMLQEKHGYQLNGSANDDMFERLDDYLPFEISWDVNTSKEQHIAGDDVPCIRCEYATQNIIELLSHYQNTHDGLYPNGFGIFLLERLILHAKPVYVPVSEVDGIDKESGAWVNDKGQLIQYYEYECRLCGFKNDWFDAVLNHFTGEHPSENCCGLNVARKIAESNPTNVRPERFSQCMVCAFILMDPTEDAMLEHYEKNKHGGSAHEKFTTHNLAERRCCQDCDFAGNIDAMQWHCADSHFSYIFLWNTLKFDESSFMYGKEFMCRVCDFTSKNDWDLAFHYQEHHFQPARTFQGEEIFGHTQYKCVLCNIVTDTLPEMITHHNLCTQSLLLSPMQEKTHARFLACNHCRKVFATSAVLWRHITLHHCLLSQLFEVDDLPEQTLKYGYWNTIHEIAESSKVQSNGTDIPRLVKHSRLLKYNDGSASASSKKSFEEKKGTVPSGSGGSVSSSGSITSSPTLRCKFCTFSTTLRGMLTRHLRSAHQHDGNLRCFGCEKHFSIITDCLQHHLHIHGLQISTETAYNFLVGDISQQNGPKFMCAWCGFRALSRTLVSNHINSKHVKGVFGRKKWRKNGPYSCQWCDYYTKNATSMRAHLSVKHQRTVSYHSLTNYRSLGADTGKSTDSSDEDYTPLKQKPRSSQKTSKNTCHALSSQCRIAEDQDCLCFEDLKTTHARFKHDPKHPHICRFCTKAFVCATTFLKHCSEEHGQWCSVSFVPQHVVIVPDPGEIADLMKRLEKERNGPSSGDQAICVSRQSDWPCELCGSNYLSLVDLQQHACEGHSSRKLLLCRYCDFTSLTEKKIVAHSHLHVRMNVVHGEEGLLPNGRVENEKEDPNSEEVVDLVTMESNSTESQQIAAEEPEIVNGGTDKIQSVALHHQDDSNNITSEVQSSGLQRARKSIRGTTKSESLYQTQQNFTQNISHGERAVTIGTCDNHVTIESGLISCSKCDFSCTDAQRMETHIKSNHTLVKSYSCKFCNFSSDQFSSLDEHLASFHKITRNHELGLQVRSASTGNTNNVLSESRSRFLYTPMPSLPVLREEVVYVQDNRVGDFAGTSSSPFVQCNGQRNFAELKCSYCGFKANSTYSLEMHMRRHESAFDEECPGGMNYRMTKMHMTSFS